jgi:hypothetical protein
MSGSDLPVPLSAVVLRLTGEVGQAVLDRVAAGDLAAAADLDQHVAAVRAELGRCPSGQPSAARLAGRTAALGGWPRLARPHHARRAMAVRDVAAAAPVRAATATAACPDVPFADNPWQADASPGIRLLLHYACGFAETAVRADWWPANPAVGDQIEWQAIRLAAVCRLVQYAEAIAALPPELQLAAASPLPATLFGVQDGLAHPRGGGRDLDALIIGAELQGLLQAQQSRRDEPLQFLGG